MTEATNSTDIAFTPSVKAMQETLGSRAQMEVMTRHRGFGSAISDDLRAFLENADSFFLSTASADGRPYIQHRGGAPGFIKVLGSDSIAFQDYPGNRQYISLGNLAENDRVALILVDYETKTRIKIWGRARIEHADANSARRIVVTIEAWDANCPKYIPTLWRETTVARATEKLTAKVAELEAEIRRLRSAKGGT